MSAEKLSPRQQMIGIMYLVLLAMLAMNASKDLLDAFLKLENGIDLTAINFVENVQPVYNKIWEMAATNSAEAKKVNKKAAEIKKATQAVFDQIAVHKKWLIDNSGGLDDKGIPEAKDNQDIGAEYFLVKENGKKLKEAIGSLKKVMLGVIDPKDQSIVQSVSTLLATEEFKDYEDNTMSWEAGMSEHLPLAAVTANLSNIQSYLRNAESIVVNYLHEQLGINTYKVNKIQAATLAQSSYIMRGESYEAQIFLAASDTTQKPTVLVGDYDEPHFKTTGQIKWLSKVDTLDVSDGFGKYINNDNSVGEHQWKGIVKIPHPNPKRKGEYLLYPFENKYMVAQPSAVVSSDKLNIMYMKLANEMSISVPGISSDKIRVTNTKCSITKKGNGQFIFTPNSVGKTDIVVQVELSPGYWETMGSYQWIIKKLPKPDVYLGKKEVGGKTNKDEILALGKVKAQYPDDFPLSSTPTIQSCKVSIMRGSDIGPQTEAPGGVFTDPQLTAIRGLRKNESIYLEMEVRGADGITYNINRSIIIK